MKKRISLFIACIMAFNISTPTVFALQNNDISYADANSSTSPVSIEIEGYHMTDVDNDESDSEVLEVSWNVYNETDDDIYISGSSGVRIAYDTDLLTLIESDGGSESEIAITTTLTENGYAADYADWIYKESTLKAYIAKSDDGSTGYVSLEISSSNELTVSDSASLATVRFSYVEGKTSEDLTSGSVRLMTVDEAYSFNQDAVASIVLSGPIIYMYEETTDSGNDIIDSVSVTLPIHPVIGIDSIDSAEVNSDYSFTLVTSKGSGITWSIDGSLPDGLSLDSTSGVISGTPTESGSFTFDVIAKNTYGEDTVELTILVDEEITSPIITTGQYDLANGKIGTEYSQMITVTGGGTITWTLTEGSLPSGLSLNSTTGEISGTPTTAGTCVFEINVTNAKGEDTKEFTIVIPAEFNLITTELPSGKVGEYYSYTIEVEGSENVYYEVAGLPDGLSINSDTGVISGTPTTKSTETVEIAIEDKSTGEQKYGVFTMVISKGDATELKSINITEITSSSITIEAVSGQLYTINTESIDENNPSYYEWTDTPTFTNLEPNTEYYIYTYIPETDNYYSSSEMLSITTQTSEAVVDFGFVTTKLPSGTVGEYYESTVEVEGADCVTFTGIDLPDGLSIDSKTGVISGTPTIASDVTFRIGAVDEINGNEPEYQEYSISINKGAAADLVSPVVISTSSSSITIEAVDGQVYAIAKSVLEYPTTDSEWTSNPVFDDLEPNTSYYVFTCILESDNYYGSSKIPFITVTTDKINLTQDMFEVENNAVDYNGDYQYLTVDTNLALNSDYTITYEDGDPINVGEYNVLIEGIGNYDGYFYETITISPLEVIIKASDSSIQKTYGEDDPDIEWEVSSSIDSTALEAFNNDSSITLIREDGEDIGQYKISINSLDTSDNFTVELAKYQFFTIFSKDVSETDVDITIDVPYIEKTFDESLIFGDVTGTIVYSEEYDYDDIIDFLSYCEVGAKLISDYEISASGNYTGSITGQVTFNIVDIEFENDLLTTNSSTPTYGDTWNEILSYDFDEINALVGSETISGAYSISINESKEYDAIPNAGDYTCSIVFNSESGEYIDVIVKSINVTISPLTVIIAWSDTDLSYTGYAQNPTATITNKVNESDDVSAVVSGEETEASTSYYTASVTGLTGTDTSNYSLSEDGYSTSFAISKSESSATTSISSSEITYGDTFTISFTPTITSIIRVSSIEYDVESKTAMLYCGDTLIAIETGVVENQTVTFTVDTTDNSIPSSAFNGTEQEFTVVWSGDNNLSDTSSTVYATLNKKAVYISEAYATERDYDVENVNVDITVELNDSDLKQDVDYTVTGVMTDDSAGENKEVFVSITLLNNYYSLAENSTTTTTSINKIDFSNDTLSIEENVKYGNSIIISADSLSLPDNSYIEISSLFDKGNAIYEYSLDATSLNISLLNDESIIGSTVQFTLCISSTNYNNFYIDVTISVTDKDVPSLSAESIIKVYDGNTVTLDDITKSATISIDSVTEDVSGKWSIKNNAALVNVTDGVEIITLVFTPDDLDAYVECEIPVSVTITNATISVQVEANQSADFINEVIQATPVTATVVDNSIPTILYGTEYGIYTTDEMPSFTTATQHIIYYQVSADNHTTVTGAILFNITTENINVYFNAPYGTTITGSTSSGSVINSTNFDLIMLTENEINKIVTDDEAATLFENMGDDYSEEKYFHIYALVDGEVVENAVFNNDISIFLSHELSDNMEYQVLHLLSSGSVEILSITDTDSENGILTADIGSLSAFMIASKTTVTDDTGSSDDTADDNDSSSSSTSSYTNTSYTTYYGITLNIDGSGTVSPSSEVNYYSVSEGSEITLTFTPDDGYYVSSVIIDITNMGSITSYTFDGVTGNHDVYVTFDKLSTTTTESTEEVSDIEDVDTQETNDVEIEESIDAEDDLQNEIDDAEENTKENEEENTEENDEEIIENTNDSKNNFIIPIILVILILTSGIIVLLIIKKRKYEED